MGKYIVMLGSLLLHVDVFSEGVDAGGGVDILFEVVDGEVTWIEDTVPVTPSTETYSTLVAENREPRAPTTDSSPLTGLAVSPRLDSPAGLTTSRPPVAADYDPLNTPLRWDWGHRVSVGEGIKRVAKVAGYTLIIRDPGVANVYSMPLPYAHRSVSGIDVKTALELLGGPGLMLVVDHPNRTIMHVVRREYTPAYDIAALPMCPDVSFAVMPSGAAADRVLIVGGVQCVY